MFSSVSVLDFLQSNWHSLACLHQSAVALAKPSLCMCLCPHWPAAALDAIDHTLFLGCPSPWAPLTYFESHFVILTHFLSHFESHLLPFVTFQITFCHLLTLLQLLVRMLQGPPLTHFLFVSWHCYPWTQIHLITSMLMGHTLTCLLQAVLFCPNNGLRLLFWQVWLTCS